MDERTCPLCGGPIADRAIRYVSSGDAPVMIVGVPAEVCERCGTETLAWDVLKLVNSVSRERPAPTRWVQVPVYQFDTILTADDDARVPAPSA